MLKIEDKTGIAKGKAIKLVKMLIRVAKYKVKRGKKARKESMCPLKVTSRTTNGSITDSKKANSYKVFFESTPTTELALLSQ